jgi:putative aldouronate transport system substrate-binding protein
VKDNQLVLDWDRTKAYNEFAKRLFDEGLIDKDFVNDANGAKAKQDFINGKTGIYGFLNANTTGEKIATIDPLKKNVPTAEVDFLAYPKSPFGAFLPTLQNPVQMTAAVSATAKNPEAVIKYIDFVVKDTTAKTLELGIEGTHYKMTEGCQEVLDPAKLKKEVSDLTTDMRMLQSATGYSKCDVPLVQFKSDPRKEEHQQFRDAFLKTYLNFDRPYPELTISEHMPTPPKDLNTVEANTDKAMSDIWLKAIVSGDKYSVDQALKDAQDAWSKAGGKQVEDWYKKWYETDKDKAFLAKDAIEISKKQYEDYRKVVDSLK